MNGIDLGRALASPSKDPKWISKTLLGGVLLVVPVVNFVIFGALVRRIKMVCEGDETLPPWNAFGEMWFDGLRFVLAGLAYELPTALILAPTFVLNGAAGSAAGPVCPAYLLAFTYSTVAAVVFLAAATNYARVREFRAFFDFRVILAGIRTGGYLTAWIFSAAVSLVFNLAFSFPGIGFVLAILAGYVPFLITGHVVGQWAAKTWPCLPQEPATAGLGPLSTSK